MTDPDATKKGGIADYRVGFGDDATLASEEAAGTFRIVVIGGFTPSADFAASAAPSQPVAITSETFDEVMTRLNPSLTIEVARAGEKALRVPLAFPRLRSFRPDVLVREVEAFRTVRGDEPVKPSMATPPTGAGGGSSIDSKGENASVLPARSLIDDILANMAPSASASPLPTRNDHEAKGALLASILAHAEVRRLERAWRGLKLLVERGAKAGVTIEIVSAQSDEVEGALARATRAPGPPVDLFVVDWEIGSSPRELERAERWACCAEAAFAPLLTNASATVLGFENLDDLARTNRRVRSLEEPRAIPFRALTERDSARWILFALNGPILRDTYIAETARLEGVAFQEESALDGGAAWIIAIAVARAVAGCGWASALTAPAYRTVSDLAVHARSDRGAPVSASAQSLVTTDVAREAAASGVSLLVTVADRDELVVPFAQMVYRGPVGKEGVRAAAELTLSDQLFVAKMVPLITEVAGTIPRDADPKAATETARIALLSLFATEGSRSPEVDVVFEAARATLAVTIRPRGFRGVSLPEITLSASLA